MKNKLTSTDAKVAAKAAPDAEARRSDAAAWDKFMDSKAEVVFTKKPKRHKVFPRLRKTVYAVYVAEFGVIASYPYGLYDTKKGAGECRSLMKKNGCRHVIVVAYDKR